MAEKQNDAKMLLEQLAAEMPATKEEVRRLYRLINHSAFGLAILMVVLIASVRGC